jgi:hypothetical protein
MFIYITLYDFIEGKYSFWLGLKVKLGQEYHRKRPQPASIARKNTRARQSGFTINKLQ